MQKIIDNKLYDTDTAELLLTLGTHHVLKLYQTAKGNFFTVSNVRGIRPRSAECVRNMLADEHEITLYTRLFGAPEEA